MAERERYYIDYPYLQIAFRCTGGRDPAPQARCGYTYDDVSMKYKSSSDPGL